MEDQQNKLSRPELDELVKRLNRLVGFAGIIVLIAVIQIAVPGFFEGLFGTNEPETLVVATEEVDAISDTLIVDNIHVRTGLYVDSGFVQVKANCLSCHSSKLITQNRDNREGWAHTIEWMQETQKLWDLGANESVILDYLAKHYAPEESGRRKLLKDIEWYEYSE